MFPYLNQKLNKKEIKNQKTMKKKKIKKKKLLGRKKKDGIEKGKHNKYSPDNIIKQLKQFSLNI